MSDPPLDTWRWAVVTANDRAGVLYIITFLGFTYSGLTFITRGFIKWRVFGLDDAAIVVAQIVSLVQFGLILYSLSAGLGKTFDLLSENDYKRMASAQYGNQIALYISLGFSKLSTILLTQRLFIRDMKKAWLVCQIMTGIIIVWTFSAPFLVSVGCSSASLAPKAPSQTCHNIIDRYKALVVTDAFTDLILTIIPASLCWKLQMSTTLKLQVLAVFAFRLPLIILASLFLKTWELSLSSNNPGVDRAPAVIFQQTQICVSLMAATIPCLKSFIRSFDTGSGVKANFGSSEQYGSGGRGSNAQGGSQSYRLSSMNRSKASGSRSESQTRLRLDNGDVKVDSRPYATGRSSPPIRNKGKRESDGDSQGSGRELYIRRDMHFEVTSEDARRVPGMEHPGMLRLPA